METAKPLGLCPHWQDCPSDLSLPVPAPIIVPLGLDVWLLSSLLDIWSKTCKKNLQAPSLNCCGPKGHGKQARPFYHDPYQWRLKRSNHPPVLYCFVLKWWISNFNSHTMIFIIHTWTSISWAPTMFFEVSYFILLHTAECMLHLGFSEDLGCMQGHSWPATETTIHLPLKCNSYPSWGENCYPFENC